MVVKTDGEEVTIIKLLHAHDSDTKTKSGSKQIKAKQTEIYLADKKKHVEDNIEENISIKNESANDNLEDACKPKEYEQSVKIVMRTVWSPFDKN